MADVAVPVDADVEMTPSHPAERSPIQAPARRENRARPRDGGDKYRPGRGRDRRSPPPRQRTPPKMPTEEEKQEAAKAEYQKLLNMRSGGTYIPPARLRALQSQITDKTSKEYQRMAWEALKKSINGLVNKVGASNIKHIVPELFNENLVRGRGLFCRSIMKAQAASLPFTPVFAAMAAIVNTKLPQVGELLVKRLVMQFRKAFKRNDKAVCLSSTTFIAHLTNQQVIHEMLAAQILLLLLQKPTDDSVEIAVGLMKEIGQHLEEFSPQISMACFDQFRNILHEADIDKRVQYAVEVLFQVRKDKFKDNPAIKEELDLIEEDDQITHRIELDAAIDVQDGLNIFKFDPEWEENEAAYKRLKAEILGEGSDEEEDSDDEDESSEEEDEEEKAVEIKDQSNTDLVNLRKTIYLTIQSAMDPEEAVHKLMKVNLPAGQEPELPSMIIESCSQEKTYTKYFGLIAERFSKINRLWTDLFEQSFQKYYETIHRYETNRLRNIARLFGHLFASDAIGWHVMSVVHLNEDETTSASRVFLKILFQEISEELGMPKLQARMRDETLQPSFEGLLPRDNPRNTRFSINYFTSIGMGALTEDMREYLANMPKPALPAPAGAGDSDSDSVSSYSSYTGSSYSSRSRSRTPPRRALDRGRSISRTPPRRARTRSYSGSRSRSHSYSYSSSRSPAPRKANGRKSYSPSPARRGRRASSDSRYRSITPPARGAGKARSYSRGRSYSRSRSPSYSQSPTSRSRSRNPPPRRAAATRRDSYSASPPARRARRDSSYSRSPSRSPPPKRGRLASRSASPPPARRRRNSSSVSSAPRKRARYSESRSPSPTPVKRRRYSYSSASRSRTRSRSPLPASRDRTD
ncbi:MIF4G-domain-containing protein [Biscogniauxia sp. FL1348]|nr:MIF4G-domain-containing protein [Biscogniauxia sp. FL1348]